MIAGIIFDMDGTLIDSEPLWRKAEVAGFEKVGIKLTAKMLAEHTAGMRNDEVVKYWFNHFKKEKGPDAKKVQTAILEKVKELIEIDGKKRALPGLDYIFHFFQEKNIPIALASSSPADIINLTLKAIGISDKFIIKCSAESESYGKPNPAVFIQTAKAMNISVENILVFEDSLNGVLAAKSAKMKCVALPANHDYEKAAFAIADIKLKSLFDFTDDIFKKLY
ncbi:MAG: HAD superfamily hydrolase (TIGR01509 family) [Planctomycetota bacterium]|jgi:HAD superfamily hydrolase (TIGR01509 family)